MSGPCNKKSEQAKNQSVSGPCDKRSEQAKSRSVSASVDVTGPQDTKSNNKYAVEKNVRRVGQAPDKIYVVRLCGCSVAHDPLEPPEHIPRHFINWYWRIKNGRRRTENTRGKKIKFTSKQDSNNHLKTHQRKNIETKRYRYENRSSKKSTTVIPNTTWTCTTLRTPTNTTVRRLNWALQLRRRRPLGTNRLIALSPFDKVAIHFATSR